MVEFYKLYFFDYTSSRTKRQINCSTTPACRNERTCKLNETSTSRSVDAKYSCQSLCQNDSGKIKKKTVTHRISDRLRYIFWTPFHNTFFARLLCKYLQNLWNEADMSQEKGKILYAWITATIVGVFLVPTEQNSITSIVQSKTSNQNRL